jgi:hypothetical protein
MASAIYKMAMDEISSCHAYFLRIKAAKYASICDVNSAFERLYSRLQPLEASDYSNENERYIMSEKLQLLQMAWITLIQVIDERTWQAAALSITRIGGQASRILAFSAALKERAGRLVDKNISENNITSLSKEISSLKKEISELQDDIIKSKADSDEQRRKRRQSYLASLESQLRELENR